jgi:hypothetical protein
VPRAFFQWNSAWSIPVASGSTESEIYAIHAATKGAAQPHSAGEIAQVRRADKRLVDSSSSKVVLQGEHAEKNSTGIKHIDRRVMAVGNSSPPTSTHWIAPSAADNPADIGDLQVQGGVRAPTHDVMGYEFPRDATCSCATWKNRIGQEARQDVKPLARHLGGPG